MTRYVLKRLLSVIIVLLIVAFLACWLVNLIPGDLAQMMLGEDASPQQLEELRKELHLNDTVFVQYFYWLKDVFQGSFGYSLQYSEDVGPLILSRMKLTVYLGLLALVISAILGVFFGILSAVTKDSILDQLISVIANMGVAMPVFWVGILAVYFLAFQLGLFPISDYVPLSEGLGPHIRSITLPVAILVLRPMATMTRQTRSAVLEVINQDYIRTAEAKGLKQTSILVRHALKNAMIPVITQFGLQVRNVIGGSVLVESVFNLPGMGRLVIDSVFNKDIRVVQGTLVLIALVVSLASMLVDVSYGYFNPKVRVK